MPARILLLTGASSRTRRRPLGILALAALTALGLLLLSGCAPEAGEPRAVDHEATVSALLPTQPPTEPPPTPRRTASATALPPTRAATAAAPPTIPPPPTYTPRPAPTRRGEGERPPAVPFRATLVDGSDLELSDTLGTPTLLAFWAPW